MQSGNREHHHGDPDDLYADVMNLALKDFICPVPIKITKKK
jgi:hypothetical protein